MADLAALENADAVRLTWNIWPHNRVEATKCVIPFAALYTPNKALENMLVSSTHDICSICLLFVSGEVRCLAVAPIILCVCRLYSTIQSSAKDVELFSIL